MDQAASEFTDLRAHGRARAARSELDAQDMLRAHVLARASSSMPGAAGCSLESWRELQSSLHEELAALVEEAYHETNRWLAGHGVLPGWICIRTSSAHARRPSSPLASPAEPAAAATARHRALAPAGGDGAGAWRLALAARAQRARGSAAPSHWASAAAATAAAAVGEKRAR